MDEEGSGACLLIKQSGNKRRFSLMLNHTTGKWVVIDNFKVRYQHTLDRVKSWANIMSDVEARKCMISLTYDREGTLVKASDWSRNHIRTFMKELKRRLDEKLLAYCWVAEVHENGGIHYHVYLMLVKGTWLPYPDKEGIWKHGMTSVTPARTPWYMVSYLKKEYQKNYEVFPKGIRAFAVWIKDKERASELRFENLKPWQKEIIKKYGLESLSEFIKPKNGWEFAGAFATRSFAEWTAKNKLKEEADWICGERIEDVVLQPA